MSIEGIQPSIVNATIMHKRLTPKVNQFNYKSFYFALPWSKWKSWPLAVNRLAIFSLYFQDHGLRTSASPLAWAQEIFNKHQVMMPHGDIVLITLPRVLGYVFNPVSFWLCLDENNQLRAYICEVNNTFGETHSYLCMKPDQTPIRKTDKLIGEKLFHVSPFLKREGTYQFKIDWQPENKFGIWIDYYNSNGQKTLVTALTGKLSPMTSRSKNNLFWRYPLITFKTIFLIHWQAIKIITKRIPYIPKPKQKQVTQSIVKRVVK